MGVESFAQGTGGDHPAGGGEECWGTCPCDGLAQVVGVGLMADERGRVKILRSSYG